MQALSRRADRADRADRAEKADSGRGGSDSQRSKGPLSPGQATATGFEEVEQTGFHMSPCLSHVC